MVGKLTRLYYDGELAKVMPPYAGPDRHARGAEESCHAGRCRNLAVWMVKSDLFRNKVTCKTYCFCGLHLRSSVRLLQERHEILRPEIVPYQDPGEMPLTKRKQVH